MRRLVFGLALAVIVSARPELYREKEDFQYSRSSSDDGAKSGYYGAQRGNMGGNYERAHNMDNLAQHQMGGLMKQVQGELGDGSHTRTGNVFTSANSQGQYGSGKYDLSSLGSRNFQESATYGDSQSQSSAANKAYESHSSSQNNARYSAHSKSHNSGYRGYQSGDLQTQNLNDGGSENEHASQSGHNSRFYTQSGYQGRNEYDQLNTNHLASSDLDTHNSQGQVRIVLRPGTRVVFPINAQATTGTRTASYYNQNTENSEAEVLNSGDQQQSYPLNSNPKHYESSYSYRKEWEKHDVKPAVAQIPVHSELYDASLSQHGSHYQNENYNQASSQSRHHTDAYRQQQSASRQTSNLADLSTQQHSSSSSGTSNSNAYSQSGYNTDANSQAALATLGTKPKSYQSSYSYHKSWERQGDPYVIKPASNGVYDTQTSQRLTDLAGSQNQYYSQNYGSRHTKSHQAYSTNDCISTCDPHTLVRRSANDFQEQNQNVYDGKETQHSQTAWQSENLGQQTQNKWADLEDHGQQAQNRWDNLQDLGQQTQNKFDNLEDLGQQTQNRFDKLEDLGQQTQNNFDNLEDLGQQTQNKFDNLEDLGQQTQNKFENLEDLGQQTQDFGQQLQELGQQTQDFGQQTNFGQQTQDFSQQTQYSEQQSDKTNYVGKNTGNSWNNLEGFGQHTGSLDEQRPANWNNEGQAGHTHRDETEDLGQETQTNWNQLNEQIPEGQDNFEGVEQNQASQHKFEQHSDGYPFESDDENKQTQGIWNNVYTSSNVYEQSKHSEEDKNQRPLSSLWDKIDNLDNDYIAPLNKKDTTDVQYNDFSHTSSSQSEHFDKHQVNSFSTDTEFTTEIDDQQYNSKDFDTSDLLYPKSTTDKTTTSTEKNNQLQNNLTLKPVIEKQKTTTEINFTFQNNVTTTTEKVDNNRSKDVGRGDIGPEDEFKDVHQSTTAKSVEDKQSPKNPQEIESLSSTDNQGNKDSVQNTISNKPNVHTVVEAPEEIEQQLQNTQQNSEVFTLEHQRAQSVHFVQQSEDQKKQSQDANKEEFETNSQNNFHASGEFEEHSNQFGQDSMHEHHQSNEFHQFAHKPDNVPHYNFHFTTPDLEQPNMHSQGHGWETPNDFYQESSAGDYSHQNNYNQQQGFHHQDGLNQQHSFHNEQDLHHEHGFHHQHDIHHQGGFHHHHHHREFNHNHGFNLENDDSVDKRPRVFIPTQNENTAVNQENMHTDNLEGKLDGSKIDQEDHHSDHHSTEQMFEMFNENGKNWIDDQQNTDQLPSDISQQNTDQKSEDFSQQNRDTQLYLHHHSHQHNTEQIFETFYEHNKKFYDDDQQNTDQLPPDFSQQNQDTQQQYNKLNNFEQINVDDLQNQGQQQESTSNFDVISLMLPEPQKTDQLPSEFPQHNTNQLPSDFSQQNTNQMSEDFSQQNQDTQQLYSQLNNFEQVSVDDLQYPGQQQERTSNFDVISVENLPEPPKTGTADVYNEETVIKKDQAMLNSSQKRDDSLEMDKKEATEPTAPEPMTENPGFWKSLGNKFTSAKNKVTSWFRS